MPVTPLTPHEREAVCDLADDLFAISLRISDDPNLQRIETDQNSAYTHINDALRQLFRHLWVPPQDIADVYEEMGNGSPADEAIETVRNEKEN